MTRQPQFVRQRLEAERESRQHELTDELAYVLEATRYVEAYERGFIEAYADGELGLKLNFLPINDELQRQFGQDAAVVYGFTGFIGPKHPTILRDEVPGEFGVQCTDGEHMVLVAIGKYLKVHERMVASSLGLHLIRLETIDQAHGLPTDTGNAATSDRAGESVCRGANRKLVGGCRRVAVLLDRLFDEVVEGRPEIVNDVASDGSEFERWLSEHVKAQPSACAVVGVMFGENRSIRSAVKVQQCCGLQSVQVVVSVP